MFFVTSVYHKLTIPQQLLQIKTNPLSQQSLQTNHPLSQRSELSLLFSFIVFPSLPLLFIPYFPPTLFLPYFSPFLFPLPFPSLTQACLLQIPPSKFSHISTYSFQTLTSLKSSHSPSLTPLLSLPSKSHSPPLSPLISLPSHSPSPPPPSLPSSHSSQTINPPSPKTIPSKIPSSLQIPSSLSSSSSLRVHIFSEFHCSNFLIYS